jgi:hypothetical protein
MVMASLDAVPDPPAVNPHTVKVAARPCEARGGLCELRLNCDQSRDLQLRWIAFTAACEPRPSDWIVLTGQASDPSPPVLESRRHLYFHS